MEMFFIVRANSPIELNSYSSNLVRHFKSLGINLFSEGQSLREKKSGLALLFSELIPGVKPTYQLRTLPNKTSHLKNLIPLHESYLMNKGVLFHDEFNEKIFFNPFDKKLKNKNMIVSGISGGGKSVFVNKLIHHLIDKCPVVILDKGGSFKNLTTYHNGEELKYGINPLAFKCPIYLRELILSVIESRKFNKLEKARLLKKIKDSLEKINTFDELLIELKEEFKDIDLYFEEFKGFFHNKDFSFKNCLYVDIERFPKNFISPLIIFILEYFKNIKESNKILVFDECWEFLGEHSEYVERCFRTFRKTGAFPIAISQSLKDFSSNQNELSSAIINNSYFKVFFPQELNKENSLQNFEFDKIKNLEFKKKCFLRLLFKNRR